MKRYVHIKIGAENAATLVCRNRIEASQRALGLVNSFRENGRQVRGSARKGEWEIDGFYDRVTITISPGVTAAAPKAWKIASEAQAHRRLGQRRDLSGSIRIS